MPANIRFEPNPRDIARLRSFLAHLPDEMRTAERDALNRTMEHGKTVASTDLAAAMTAKKGSVAKRITLIKATKVNLASAIKIRGGRGVNLAGFSARQTATGVTAKVLGTSQQVPHAFLTKGLSGQRIVALRAGAKRAMAKGRYAGRIIVEGPRAGQALERQPLAAQYGPTVAETFEKTPGVAAHTTTEIAAALPKNLQNQIERFLK